MSDPTTLRDQARKAVLRQYAQAHDAHSEQEQINVYLGLEAEAEQEHIAALVALKGYRAELDDRTPDGLA